MNGEITITEDEFRERLAQLHAAFAGQWYGLDNATDEEIVDALFHGKGLKHYTEREPEPVTEAQVEDAIQKTLERSNHGGIMMRMPGDDLPSAGTRRFPPQ